MATSKIFKICTDMINSKLLWCYKKYQNKDDEYLPTILSNLSYYPKNVRTIIESRDQNCVDELTSSLIEVLKDISTSCNTEDETFIYYWFKSHYGDSSSRSSLGQIYNNVTSGWNGEIIKNDGWALIRRLLETARRMDYLPTKWVSYISILMQRVKLIAGRKTTEMPTNEIKLSTKLFNMVILDMKFQLDSFGEEPEVYCWDYDGSIYSCKYTNSHYPIFDYHSDSATLNDSLLFDRSKNHYGIEWELEFKTEMNYIKCMRELIKQGLMFNEDKSAFNILPMHDGSIRASFGAEIIFAADTYENIIDRLNKVKAIFKKYDVKSSTEANSTGIHITQDWNYLKGNAFYNLSKYVMSEMPISEYMQITKRNPNGYCNRNWNHFQWVTDGENHILDTSRYYDRYYALNVTNYRENRLEWRMFNSCCDPVECIKWVHSLNEKFNKEALAQIKGNA